MAFRVFIAWTIMFSLLMKWILQPNLPQFHSYTELSFKRFYPRAVKGTYNFFFETHKKAQNRTSLSSEVKIKFDFVMSVWDKQQTSVFNKKSWRLRFGCIISFSYIGPVDNIINSLHVIRTQVLILKVVCMFPHINSKKGNKTCEENIS